MRIVLALLVILAPVAVLGFATGPLSAQSMEELAFSCGGAQGGGVEAWCYETLLGAQAAQGGLGMAGSLGSQIPGSASTLGHRIRSFPRISLSVRGGFSRFTLPDLSGDGGLPEGERTVSVPALHVSTSIGVLQGFTLAPTVGGILSLDFIGTASLISKPDDAGFRDGVGGVGIGARLGLLRESFTLPAISLSGSYRSLGETGLGNVEQGDASEALLDLNVTSLRGTVGKDFLGVGLMAGLGWDRYGGDLAVLVRDPETGMQGGVTDGSFESGRMLAFVGASRTFLILQVSGEAGWAQGFDPDLPGRPGGDFDPTAGSLFGSLAARVTF